MCFSHSTLRVVFFSFSLFFFFFFSVSHWPSCPSLSNADSMATHPSLFSLSPQGCASVLKSVLLRVENALCMLTLKGVRCAGIPCLTAGCCC